VEKLEQPFLCGFYSDKSSVFPD